MHALVRRLWDLRALLAVAGAGAVVTALVTTVDTIEISTPFDRSPAFTRAECGSPRDPADLDTLDREAAQECIDRLANARETRVAALSAAVAILALLNLAAFGRLRRPEPFVGSRPASLLLDARSERIHLRLAVAADLRALLDTCDQAMLEANGWAPEHLAAFATEIAPPSGLRSPLVVSHAVVLRSSDEVVGGVSVQQVAADVPVQVGWWIGPAHRREGLGAEAARLAIDALHDAGHLIVSFGTTDDNIAIQRIASSLGAEPVRTGPHQLPNGSNVESIWYHHQGVA